MTELEGVYKRFTDVERRVGLLDNRERLLKEFVDSLHERIRAVEPVEKATTGEYADYLRSSEHALWRKLCGACKHVDPVYGVHCVKHEHHVCRDGSSFEVR